MTTHRGFPPPQLVFQRNVDATRGRPGRLQPLTEELNKIFMMDGLVGVDFQHRNYTQIQQENLEGVLHLFLGMCHFTKIERGWIHAHWLRNMGMWKGRGCSAAILPKKIWGFAKKCPPRNLLLMSDVLGCESPRKTGGNPAVKVDKRAASYRNLLVTVCIKYSTRLCHFGVLFYFIYEEQTSFCGPFQRNPDVGHCSTKNDTSPQRSHRSKLIKGSPRKKGTQVKFIRLNGPQKMTNLRETQNQSLSGFQTWTFLMVYQDVLNEDLVVAAFLAISRNFLETKTNPVRLPFCFGSVQLPGSSENISPKTH